MREFYDRFEKDLRHAEEHMTDIKRMEKPTDLMCEKCGKPLVIKWGKHGSFLACTGYPDFPPRAVEADFGKVQQESSKRQERVRWCHGERRIDGDRRRQSRLRRLSAM